MMVIQIILILLFVVIGLNFLRSRGTSRTNALKKLALILFIIVAIIAVIYPELLSDLAKLVGVGRGTDLLTYGLAVIIIFQILNGYVKDREQEKRFVKLVRKVAILEAQAK
ncbi:MAG TPA: DUF2304 domain-containing protein, partial [Candidatus Saccharimonadaceae bacterium]|nr:DUF2304 domain-containing protein [Candidatus Saccharimonadaceae bacterium]